MLAACGGATGTGLTDGGNDASSGNDGSSSDASSTDSGNNDSGMACPDESGRYSVTFSGLGCGTIGMQASICITETNCSITIATGITSGGSNEVSGMTPIQNDGSFSGAAIKEGSMSRTGCTGSWDMGSSTLTIDCGGVNTNQSCEATLVRTAGKCG